MGSLRKVANKLKRHGYRIFENENSVIISDENQIENRTLILPDGEEIKYAPLICGETDYEVSEELRLLVGKDWYWECEYKGTFRLCRA